MTMARAPSLDDTPTAWYTKVGPQKGGNESPADRSFCLAHFSGGSADREAQGLHAHRPPSVFLRVPPLHTDRDGASLWTPL